MLGIVRGDALYEKCKCLLGVFPGDSAHASAIGVSLAFSSKNLESKEVFPVESSIGPEDLPEEGLL